MRARERSPARHRCGREGGVRHKAGRAPARAGVQQREARGAVDAFGQRCFPDRDRMPETVASSPSRGVTARTIPLKTCRTIHWSRQSAEPAACGSVWSQGRRTPGTRCGTIPAISRSADLASAPSPTETPAPRFCSVVRSTQERSLDPASGAPIGRLKLGDCGSLVPGSLRSVTRVRVLAPGVVVAPVPAWMLAGSLLTIASKR